jgi:hypothetical protein
MSINTDHNREEEDYRRLRHFAMLSHVTSPSKSAYHDKSQRLNGRMSTHKPKVHASRATFA